MLITEMLVSSRKFTYAGTNPCTFITVHETGNANPGADAAAHGRLQARGNSRNASWHYTVDDKQVVQSFPDDVRCWHAGDGRGHGNLSSIAIEICVNRDGDYAKAVANAAELVRTLMARHGIPLANVVQHNRWSGKNCPQNLRSGAKGITWAQFLALVGTVEVSNPKPAPTPQPAPSKPAGKTVAQMSDEVIAGKHGNGHANRQRSLGVSSTVYQQVRAEVNRRAGLTTPAPKPKPTGKSISQMATEVLRGDHGNGHANRRKSLGVSEAVYQQVRAEVNRRAR